jgi:putative two-component system response regulator
MIFVPRPDETILIVDDAPKNLYVLGELLKSAGYVVRAANSGAAALRMAELEPRPGLILLDIMMPEMDGFEVLERLRANSVTEDIPVVFLTALNDKEHEEHGLALGASDYITKPFQSAVVLARVRTQLQAKWARDWLLDRNALLDAEVRRRMRENDLIQSISIRALANLAELRDNETGNHILRTQAYIEVLAQRLREHPRFTAVLTPSFIELLVRSAPLHDIGKVGIPDHILQKPGALTAGERAVMQTHAELGARAIEAAQQSVDGTIEFLAVAAEIARYHHERWDGSGYPHGLAGEAIPVAARLMALADVFDALVNRRVYKGAFSFESARAIILEGRGSHFDPDIVDAFLACCAEFEAIALRFADSGGATA